MLSMSLITPQAEAAYEDADATLRPQIHGTRNKRNIAKALVLALEGQELPEDVYGRQLKEAQQAAALEARQQGTLPEQMSRRGNLMVGRTLGALAGRPQQQQQQQL